MEPKNTFRNLYVSAPVAPIHNLPIILLHRLPMEIKTLQKHTPIPTPPCKCNSNSSITLHNR